MQTVLYIFVMMLGVFIQAVVGFGGTLVILPLGVMLVGLGVAKPSMTIIVWLAAIAVAAARWKSIDRRELGKMAAVMLAGVVLGVWATGLLPQQILLISYGVIVLFIGIQKFVLPHLGEKNRFLQETGLILAGLMQGLFVSGGSFLAVYATAKIKEKDSFRATVNAVWALIDTVMIGMYAFGVGGTVLSRESLLVTAAAVIPAFVATWLGGVVAKKVNQAVFSKIVYAVLILSGILLVVSNV